MYRSVALDNSHKTNRALQGPTRPVGIVVALSHRRVVNKINASVKVMSKWPGQEPSQMPCSHINLSMVVRFWQLLFAIRDLLLALAAYMYPAFGGLWHREMGCSFKRSNVES